MRVSMYKHDHIVDQPACAAAGVWNILLGPPVRLLEQPLEPRLVRALACMHARVCAHMFMYQCVHERIYFQVRVHMCVRACVHVRARACGRMLASARACARALACACFCVQYVCLHAAPWRLQLLT